MTSCVLIVDDDDDIRETLAMVLRDEGYRTELAADGVVALEHLKSHPAPNLILLDLMMPRLHGETVLEELKSNPALSHVPVVVLSGDVLARDRLERLHADDFMLKPVELDDLLSVVHRFAPPGGPAPLGRTG